MIIAVDAVGGDHYPHNPVEGAIRSLGESSSLEIVLVGPEELITEELSKHEYDEDRIRILHAPEIIGMRESPASAVKTKTNSSITIGLSAYKKGEVDAFVSEVNTCSLFAASILFLCNLDGLLRDTIAYTTQHFY